MTEPVAKALKPWLIASVILLVGSLFLLITAVSLGFVSYQGAPKPVWLVLLGVLAVAGIGLGFAGFFLLMLAAGWRSLRQSKKIQVIPPARPAKE